MSDATAATRTITITRRDGSVHTLLYDAADAEIVESRRWSVSSQGYAVSQTSMRLGPRRLLRLHRLILGLAPEDPRTVDHVSGARLDNRRANLRVVSHQANVAHQAVVNDRGASRFRGVSRASRSPRWVAKVKLDYRSHYIGTFDSQEAAAAAVAAFRAAHGVPEGY